MNCWLPCDLTELVELCKQSNLHRDTHAEKKRWTGTARDLTMIATSAHVVKLTSHRRGLMMSLLRLIASVTAKATRSSLVLRLFLGNYSSPKYRQEVIVFMLLPMELRNYRELDAQLQYAPFRATVFTNRGDELAAARGPGALFREEWNSLAGNAQRYKPLSLYRTERDVNPTPTATVQRFYDPQEATDVGSQVKRKGNAVVSLKSNVPRFHGSSDAQRGPGSYFSDRYHGAFPALLAKRTPRTVRLEKLQAKQALAATFGVVPVPIATTSCSPVATLPAREPRLRAAKPVASFSDIPLETTRLAPALTPRNAYQNPVIREFVLALRPPESTN